MDPVRPKKGLGQHFLKDENIARKIVSSYSGNPVNVIEIGPGTGVLTKYLVENKNLNCYFVETDREAVDYLRQAYPQAEGKIIHADFLRYDVSEIFDSSFGIIGNFPYYISSQILFRALELRSRVAEVVCMIQKEVAERISSKEGSRQYGIMSVLLQAFYDIEYLFTVSEHVFSPKPKVKSAVLRLRRNSRKNLDCDETLFFQVVKSAFNQRRKTLRNSLKAYLPGEIRDDHLTLLLTKRAEQLSVEDFIGLVKVLGQR